MMGIPKNEPPDRMKILLCHNYYQMPGGEDQVFADEGSLLEDMGHEVVRYSRHNDELNSLENLSTLRKTIWNSQSEKAVEQLIAAEKPQVMHCTNTFPLISPSIYYAAKRNGVAVVQSLHNYRLICPNAQLLREARICTDCLGKPLPWPAVMHGCYRESRAASAAVAGMLFYHRSKATWTNAIDRYIALTPNAKTRFVEGGLPAAKISVKPNFIRRDPGIGTGTGNQVVYAGRLSVEKGVKSLLNAWKLLDLPLELKILGDGPLADEVAKAAASDSRIVPLGHTDRQTTDRLIGEAAVLVMPSIWAEPFGLSVIEAYAKSTPVVAARIGALEEIVKEGVTGHLFEPGNARHLADTIRSAVSDPASLKKMRNRARAEYETFYTPKANYSELIGIYEAAITESKA